MGQKRSYLEKCVLAGRLHVTRLNEQNHKTDPNCESCDVYEEDAKKYGWTCYKPISRSNHPLRI